MIDIGLFTGFLGLGKVWGGWVLGSYVSGGCPNLIEIGVLKIRFETLDIRFGLGF